MASEINRFDAVLFTVTVLTWGTTWFVILGQLGVVHPIVSVGWRFLLAAGVVFGICWIRAERLRLSAEEHGLCLLLGLLLFSLNYGLFYTASLSLTTGLVSIVFSTMVFWNALGARWLMKQPLDYRALAGGVIGIFGLMILFWDELLRFSWLNSDSSALVLCLLGTLSASSGNLVSAALQKRSMNVWNSTAYGMLYGTALTFGFAGLSNYPIQFEWTLIYVGSLLYLVIFGSVIAFGSYLTLVGRIGPGRAAYATIVFPVVAILVSVLFEDYRLTPLALVAVALVVAGNWLALSKSKVQKSSCRA
ncbi:EamA family transporter [Litorivicinus sp.]|nr:EamA family transporter [Litorivicinus sp.]